MTLSLPSEQRGLWSSYGAVPSPMFLTITGYPGRVVCHILDMRKIAVLLFKIVFMVDVSHELTTNSSIKSIMVRHYY